MVPPQAPVLVSPAPGVGDSRKHKDPPRGCWLLGPEGALRMQSLEVPQGLHVVSRAL